MHWVGIAILALLLGWFYTFISPKIQATIPASASSSKLAQTFLTGAIILFAVFVSAFILSMVGVHTMIKE